MNVNSIAGFYNLPSMLSPAPGSSEFAYKVPAAGLYPGLPSPAQQAGNLFVLPVQTNDGPGSTLDGHPFRVRVEGSYSSHTAQNTTIKLYQISAANVAAGPSLTAGNLLGSSGVVVAGSGTGRFSIYADILWDSGTQKLDALFSAWVGPPLGTSSTVINPYTAGVGTVGVAVAESDLNFMVSFQFNSGVPGKDAVGPLSFYAERL